MGWSRRGVRPCLDRERVSLRSEENHSVDINVVEEGYDAGFLLVIIEDTHLEVADSCSDLSFVLKFERSCSKLRECCS